MTAVSVLAESTLLGTETMAKLLVEVQGLARELVQAQRDVDRLAKENAEQCDEIHALREENARLRAELEAKR
jgi:regulator of replication initiation timing